MVSLSNHRLTALRQAQGERENYHQSKEVEPLALGIAGEDSLIYRRVAMIETTSIPPLPTAPQATSPAVRGEDARQ